MQRKYRLNNSGAFRYLYKKGTSVAGSKLVLIYAPSKYPLRVGVVVSKKVGKAVVRNKTRRRIKEAFAANIARVKDKTNYIVLARQSAAAADFKTLETELVKLLERASLIEKTARAAGTQSPAVSCRRGETQPENPQKTIGVGAPQRPPCDD